MAEMMRRLRPGAVALCAIGLIFLSALIGMPVQPTAVRAASSVSQTEPAYASVAIVSPTQEETIHDNTGSVAVHVETEPPLQTHRGHLIRISLDGKPVATQQSGVTVLNEVERGTHELRAAVVDAEGHEVITSPAVTFYMWQASALFRRGKK